MKSQDVSNIGNLNLTCHADNNLGLSGKRVTLDVYPDTSKSAEAFTTNLDGLNFIFKVDGQELKPNNSINKPKKIVI